MIHSIAPTELIYKYNISSGVYTPACDIPLLRSLFLSDTNNKKYNNRLCFKMLTHEFYFLLSIRPPLGTYYWDISLSAGSLPMVGHTAVKHSQPSVRTLLLILYYWCPVKNKEISQRTNK